MGQTFKRPRPNRFLYRFFLRINPFLLSRGITWVVGEESWSNWKLIPPNSAYFIASKHAHFNDHFCIGGLAGKIGAHCLYVSIPEAFEQFGGLAGIFVRGLGGFPVERGGTNIQAMRYIAEASVDGKYPLVIFPEGELYFLNDVVTPLKAGTALFALEGAKARDAAAKPDSMYILPVGLKYVYTSDVSGLLQEKLANCEKSFYGKSRQGDLLPRIFRLMDAVEASAEGRYRLKPEGKSAEERFLSLSRQLVEILETKAHGKLFSGDLSDRARRLMAHFKKNSPEYEASLYAIHCLDFRPGYLDKPTQERLMESLRKLERMITANENPSFPGKRDLLVKVEPPIKVHEYLPCYLDHGTKRETIERLTLELQKSLERSVEALCRQAKLHGSEPLKAGILLNRQ